MAFQATDRLLSVKRPQASCVLSGALLALGLILIGDAVAADQTILGKKLVVKAPTSGDKVIILGRETGTDIAALAGDPTASGASLNVDLVGPDVIGQGIYSLDAADWSATATGFSYSGPGGPFDSVTRLVLKRTPAGLALLKVVLKGSGFLPPNPGTSAVVSLEINGGDRYCVALGGEASGTVVKNDDTKWIVKGATLEPACPYSGPKCCQIPGMCGWTASLDDCLVIWGASAGAPGTVCDAATGTCAAPPASFGNCCSGQTSLGNCVAGPAATGICSVGTDSGFCPADGGDCVLAPTTTSTSSTSTTSTTAPPVCGDATCNGSEDACTCPADCNTPGACDPCECGGIDIPTGCDCDPSLCGFAVCCSNTAEVCS